MGDALPVPIVIRLEQPQGERRSLVVERAPTLSAIDSDLLVDCEYRAEIDGAAFDGDVLTITAANGVFRYRVERHPYTADMVSPNRIPRWASYLMHRIDEVA